MKKFLLTAFGAALLFIGLGVVVDSIGAKFKSDEKALALIKQARIAIGGDAALAEIKGLSIKGSSTHTFDIDGVARTENGESEIVMQLSGMLSRRVSIGDKQLEAVAGTELPTATRRAVVADGKQIIEFAQKDAESAEGTETRQTRVLVRRSNENGETTATPIKVVDGKFVDEAGNVIKIAPADGSPVQTRNVIVVKKDGSDATYTVSEDGTMNVDGKTVKVSPVAVAARPNKGNELARLALMLLLTPPNGMDAAYTFAGEGNIGGIDVNTIDAELGGSSFRLHLDRYTNLPVAINYSEAAVMTIIARKVDGREIDIENVDVKGKAVFTGVPDTAKGTDRQVRLSDFRSVNGVLLPHEWTTYSNDAVVDAFTVSSYEVNPPETAVVKGRMFKVEKQK
ncbi:MAG: hypothetical protein KF855_09015 [Acidobacteria bacterium]|nr:hypothetical protein [Acidobacteriota bacterium]